MDYFQVTNVLDDIDYAQLMAVKDEFFGQKSGALLIQKDGQITQTLTDLKGNIIDGNSVLNGKMDIEGFSLKYPPIFIKVLQSIQDSLVKNGIKNPKPYESKTYRKDTLTKWHRHKILKGYKYKQWYCVIYYMHPNWNVKNGGQIRISYLPELPGEKFDCLSNSFVAHHGAYGHTVEDLKFGYTGNRDIFLTHWVSDLT